MNQRKKGKKLNTLLSESASGSRRFYQVDRFRKGKMNPNKKFTFRNLSIKVKLLLIIMLVNLPALMIASFLFVIHDIHSYRNHFVDQKLTLAKVIGENTKVSLLFNLPKDANDLLAGLRNEGSVEAAFLFGEKGNVFAGYRREKHINLKLSPDLKGETHIFKDHSLLISYPIVQKEKKLGRLLLQSDLRILNSIIYRDISITFIIIFLTSIFVFLLSSKLQHLISEPILRLAGVMESISKTQDFSVRVKKRGNDEIGLLFDGFNHMLKQIQIREKGRDIAEGLLRKSEERFDFAVTGSSDGLWDWPDVAKESIWWAPRYYELLGYQDQEIESCNSTFRKLLHEEDRDFTFDLLQKHFEDRVPFDLEYRLLTKQGKYRWFRGRGQALWDEKGKPMRMAGSIQDITDRKNAEDELAKHRDKLEELVQARTKQLEQAQKKLIRKERLATVGQLTATVSHEIRNPLGAMRSSIAVIKKLVPRKKGILTDSIDIADRSITRCDKVIKDLLDFTRVHETQRKSTNIDRWLKEILNEFNLPESIAIIIDLNCDVEVSIDREGLRRAVTNIVENARDAMMESNGTPVDHKEKKLTVCSRIRENRLELIIGDTGVGIHEKDREDIFEPLFSTKSFGVGLGIPIVKQILEIHGGGLGISSTFGEGTLVTLWLPKPDTQKESEV